MDYQIESAGTDGADNSGHDEFAAVPLGKVPDLVHLEAHELFSSTKNRLEVSFANDTNRLLSYLFK